MAALIIILAALLAAVVGWPLTAGVLALARTRNPAEPTLREDSSDDPQEEAVPGEEATGVAQPQVLRGGTIIGLLERAGVVLCIVFDQPVAIAYIVAVKGLGRYPELKQTPAASERFIIGTLASMTFAAVIAVIARWLIGLL